MSWTCPKCDKRFSRDHQSHFCEKVSQAEFLSLYSEHSVSLYLEFLAFAQQHFEIREQFSRKAVTWYAPNDRYMLVTRLKKKWLDCYYDFSAEILEFPVYKTAWSEKGDKCHHFFRLHDSEDLEEGLRRRLEESVAFALGVG
jgi:hypothetical protein